jgi:hypothetical protein
MKKFNTVLAFGDSHVAGCELSNEYSLEQYLNGDINLEQADSSGKKHAFPQIVADHLNVPCYNYSMTGGSNARSIRKLINAVQEYPNSLVLFGYTCVDRKEFYYPLPGHYLGKDQDSFIQVGMQWQGLIEKDTVKGKRTHPLNELFVNHFLFEYNDLDQTMFLVDSICNKHAQNFLHIPLFPEKFTFKNNVLDFEGETNYLSWCSKNKFNQLPYLHYDKQAHELLAKLILKYI